MKSYIKEKSSSNGLLLPRIISVSVKTVYRSANTLQCENDLNNVNCDLSDWRGSTNICNCHGFARCMLNVGNAVLDNLERLDNRMKQSLVDVRR
jgi:hypothetical protein